MLGKVILAQSDKGGYEENENTLYPQIFNYCR